MLSVPGSSSIQLHSEGRALRLEPTDSSGVLGTLLSMLDGTKTLDEILHAMRDFDRLQVIDSLRRLHESYLLEDADPVMEKLSGRERASYLSQLSFMAHFTLEPRSLHETAARSCVAVLGLGATGSRLVTSLADSGVGGLVGIALPTSSEDEAADLHNHLREECANCNSSSSYRGVTLTSDGPEAIGGAVQGIQLLIAALDRYDPVLLAKLNEAFIHAGVMWMPVGIRAWEGYVGPTIIPRETACYACYDLRMKANLAEYESYRIYEDHLRTGTPDRVFGSFPQFSPIVAGIAATEAIRILTRCYPPVTFGRMFTLDFLRLTAQFHEILKLPRCPVCGEPSQQLPMIKPWIG